MKMQPPVISTAARQGIRVRLSRGQLYKILGNPIYVGDIPHQGKLHKGQHKSIIDRETRDSVRYWLSVSDAR
jgi:hypothetical protein